ncbi:DUF6493 family protein [Streptomyces sp. NPDC089799]|uniref:DUF6493 family protein n=1 Tax=Streptomyces sp. NPDC089799 TaxID=3155066 RepID=UPI0034150E96
MNDLMSAIRAGRSDLISALLAPLDRAARRTLLGELQALRKEPGSWDWTRWHERAALSRGLWLAGAGCHTGAAAAAAWIGARDLRPQPSRSRSAHLMTVLEGQSAEWLGDVAHRLAARRATAEEDHELIAALVSRSGCAVPTGEPFVHGWVRSLTDEALRHRSQAGRAPDGLSGLGAALRRNPWTAELVPRLFETVEPAPSMAGWDQPDTPGHWPVELAALAAEGVVERRVLLDGAVARLLRGGRPAGLKVFMALLRQLEPTRAEQVERIADWAALASDAPSGPAGYAQGVLAGLAESGELDHVRLAEVSAAVLFRPEKKFARAQLVLLGKVLRRDREARHALLPVAGPAFGHPDLEVQERALALVARHLREEDVELREELLGQAAALSAGLRERAAEVLGGVPEDGGAPGAGGATVVPGGGLAGPVAGDAPYEEVLPPAPERRPQPAAPDSVAETVELVAAVLAGRRRHAWRAPDPVDPAEFERALDGLVRHAHRDRAALALALRPALAGLWWATHDASPDGLAGLELPVAALLGTVRAGELRLPRDCNARDAGCPSGALEDVVDARMREVALRLLGDPQPFLLATPSWETGTIEPGDLVARLEEYAGRAVGPVDFAQALLRVRRDGGAAAAARALNSGEGRRLAEWLDGAGDRGLPERTLHDPADVHEWNRTRADHEQTLWRTAEHSVVRGEFPVAFRRLAEARTATCWRCYHWPVHDPQHAAVLPEDRETLAAWATVAVTACATAGEEGACGQLPRLAELGGPAGPVLHLLVATGLGARHAEDRLAAVDALLVMAARGELDTALVGRELAELLRRGTVKPNRLADAARTAASTGAYGTVWAVLGEAVPGVLGAEPLHGAGELLAVAAECAEQSGAAGPCPVVVVEAAGRGGSSQLVKQARRLRAALGG